MNAGMLLTLRRTEDVAYSLPEDIVSDRAATSGLARVLALLASVLGNSLCWLLYRFRNIPS
jgi:hypothetical protein